MLKRVTALIMALCLAASLSVLAACGPSDNDDFKGEWKVKGSEVVFVFTGTQLKSAAGTLDYTLDTNNKTITYTENGQEQSSADYSFSDDKQKLTLQEHYADGGTRKIVFVKVSNNANADPS